MAKANYDLPEKELLKVKIAEKYDHLYSSVGSHPSEKEEDDL